MHKSSVEISFISVSLSSLLILTMMISGFPTLAISWPFLAQKMDIFSNFQHAQMEIYYSFNKFQPFKNIRVGNTGFYLNTALTASCPFGLILGGTMSGVKAAGGSRPACFLWMNHIARANCSGFNLPSWWISHKFLRKSKSFVHKSLTYWIFQTLTVAAASKNFGVANFPWNYFLEKFFFFLLQAHTSNYLRFLLIS